MPNPRVYFEFKREDGTELGRIVLELFQKECPKTVENFRALCTGEKGIGPNTGKRLWYQKSVVHRVIPGFMAQMGDFSKGNGSGGESIYGRMFDDEAFVHKHKGRGYLSMANRGPDTNGSQFFVLFKEAPHLDGKHVVFGKMVSGEQTLAQLENAETDEKDRPRSKIVVSKCGELVAKKKTRANDELTSPKKKQKKESDDDSDDSSESDKEEPVEKPKPEKKPEPKKLAKTWKGPDGRIRKGRGFFRHDTRKAQELEPKRRSRFDRSPRRNIRYPPRDYRRRSRSRDRYRGHRRRRSRSRSRSRHRQRRPSRRSRKESSSRSGSRSSSRGSPSPPKVLKKQEAAAASAQSGSTMEIDLAKAEN